MSGTTQEPELEVFPDADALADAAAERFRAVVTAAVQARGRATVALSGGSTPRALYRRLAAGPLLPWDRIALCFGDERNVPPDHPDSNARMAREALTGAPFVPPASVHRIEGELPADEAAARYEQVLRRLFAGATTFPRFDLVLLGLGPDGHCASLFPGTEALRETGRWVAANWVEKFRTHRVTLTFPVLNAAAEVQFLVAGADKRWALDQVLRGRAPVSEVPSRGVHPADGRLTFLVDRAAAAGLTAPA